MTPANTIFFLSDEHTREALGCSGHPVVKTPNLDRVASRGTQFTSAYSNSPLCVPARGCLATGRHVHETRYWDNGHPFDGGFPSWGLRLRDAGHPAVAIGKLHYRDGSDANGFSEEIIPLHVVDKVGDLIGLLRSGPAHYEATENYAANIGPGETDYTDYDRRIADAACAWLGAEAPKYRDQTWVLFVSFVSPHFPLIAPPEFFDLYPPDAVPWPRFYDAADRPTHPFFEGLHKAWNYDDYFDEERVRVACAAYYGLCSFLDDNIGKVLAALDTAGLAQDTRVIYSSDHGEMLGNRGIWSTSVMYEESVGVPLVMAGPDIPSNHRVSTPVSHVDLFQTLVESAGVAHVEADRTLPGRSLFDIAKGAEPDRVVLSQYHAGGAVTGCFMIRSGRWKYVHYVGMPPQLFDLEADPLEAHDLGESTEHAEVRARCETELRERLDPEAASAQAFADQAATIAMHGGPDAIVARGDYGYSPAPR